MNRTTLEPAKGRVLYVRHHTTDVIPGHYSNPMALEEVEPGVWEAKIANEAMASAQRRDFGRAVVERGDIAKIIWTSYRDGEIFERETVFISKGRFARNPQDVKTMSPTLPATSRGVANMGQKVVVSMDIQNEAGESVADVVATFKNLDYAAVVEIEKNVVGSFIAMGEARAAAKAA